ncbi:rhamnulokinase family protein [Lactovum odontotermitis]
MQKNVLAFDLGASSGRAVLGQYKDGSLKTEEIHRFSNGPVNTEGTLYWDLDALFSEIIVALNKATEKCRVDSLGFDTWGVDFGLMNQKGDIIQNPVSYRDSRTAGMMDFVSQNYLSEKDLFERTGNQLMEINTLFQLIALREQQPDLLAGTLKIMNIPDLFNYLLTGEIRSEISIASTTQMLNPLTKEWDKDLLEQVDLPLEILPALTSEGEVLGKVKEIYANQEQTIKVMNVCEHDTASAVVSVPALEQDFIFISCGTWSLVGTEISEPILSEDTFKYNLTNEIGQGGTIQLLKNCTGLWIIQELKREFAERGHEYSFPEIAETAAAAEPFRTFIDTEDPRFALPGDMIEKLQKFAEETDQKVPDTAPQLFRCVYEGLALKYKETIDQITAVTGKVYQTVYIVGGGCKADILCQMVADATGLTVSAGPAEATALGNIAIQLKAQGSFKDIKEIRNWVKENGEIRIYQPK